MIKSSCWSVEDGCPDDIGNVNISKIINSSYYSFEDGCRNENLKKGNTGDFASYTETTEKGFKTIKDRYQTNKSVEQET